jgi:methylmalonyl-CoA mutase
MKEEGYNQLFNDFPDITTEAWEEKIMADLKGVDYGNKLVWKTDEGIHVKPYYRIEDLDNFRHLDHAGSLKPEGRAPNSWTICQDIFPGKDLVEANGRIKSALRGGAQAIRVQFLHAPGPQRDTLEKLFDGIHLEATEILFQGSLGADALYDLLLELASGRGVSLTGLRGSIGADPLGKMARNGIPIASLETLGNLVRRAKETSPGVRMIDVNGALIQNAGSTLVEELAFSLAMANEYMAHLTARGIEPVDAVNTMQLSLAAGSNYFMEIAKIRAARILWSTICEGYGMDPVSSRIRIHSTSSEWNMTLYDPHVNMLRGTTEAMSAILGGADLVTVLPFNHPYGITSDFSNRIARNVQIILRDEAYFERVADPSAGSYYIESLTDSIAEKAWDLFRETEAKGGFMKAFESGWIQEKVLSSKQKKLDRAASGRGHILGTNAFPNFNEIILAQLKQDDASDPFDSPMPCLRPFRVASMFEEVRLETEKNVKRPRVFLFKYGNPAWMTARAAFSGNFFACAGYEIIDQPAQENIETGITSAKNTGADIVVLCSADDSYLTTAPVVHEALKDQAIVVIAGFPSDDIEAIQKAGIEHFIHIRSNLLDTLKQFNRLLLGSQNHPS